MAKSKPIKLLLCSSLCPGDILTLTAAVESLHKTYPGEFLTDTRTTCGAVWEHNPHLTPIADDDRDATRIECRYPSVNHSNQRAVPFLAGYTSHLAEQIGRPLSLTTNRPHLYLSSEEKTWINQVRQHHTNGRDVPFWLLNAGTKSDYPAKQWPVESFQEVVDRTRGRILWVQIGECSPSHFHPDLSGVIDLRGKTDLRQLIRLAWHARGGLGGVTLLQHLCAAWEKPYLCLLGGREPVTWTTYPLQTTLHTVGTYQLPCCRLGGCWKSRVVPLSDGDSKNQSLCERPVFGLQRPVGECMTRITPADVVAAIERMR